MCKVALVKDPTRWSGMKTQLDCAIALGAYAHQIIQHNFQRCIDQEEAVLKDQDPELSSNGAHINLEAFN
jgi:hypothetical protein